MIPLTLTLLSDVRTNFPQAAMDINTGGTLEEYWPNQNMLPGRLLTH